jgi:hypothetical protein
VIVVPLDHHVTALASLAADARAILRKLSSRSRQVPIPVRLVAQFGETLNCARELLDAQQFNDWVLREDLNRGLAVSATWRNFAMLIAQQTLERAKRDAPATPPRDSLKNVMAMPYLRQDAAALRERMFAMTLRDILDVATRWDEAGRQAEPAPSSTHDDLTLLISLHHFLSGWLVPSIAAAIEPPEATDL